MRCVASLQHDGAGIRTPEREQALVFLRQRLAPRLGRQRGDDASQRGDMAVAAIVDQALPFARRIAGAEFQRVVDHGEIALVVQETFVGVDFGVDANPEVHVLLDAFGTRNGFGARAAGASASSHTTAAQQDWRGEGRFLHCRAHLHSLARIQAIVLKTIAVNWPERYVARHPGVHASKILTAGPPPPT